jgi:hypothetical protein
MDSNLFSFFYFGEAPEEDNASIMKIRRAVSLSSSLPAISEDGDFIEPRGGAPSAGSSTPAIPARSLRRNSNRNLSAVGRSRFLYQDNPPSYWEDDNSIDGKDPEKVSRWRTEVINNKHVAKRGGWLRLCLVVVVLLFCIAGLVVGLVFGLKKKGHKS